MYNVFVDINVTEKFMVIMHWHGKRKENPQEVIYNFKRLSEFDI